MKNLESKELCNVLGKERDYEAFDFQGVHLVLLNSLDEKFGRGGGRLSERQLTWLEGDLCQAQGPTLVFSHHPLDEQDLSAHRDFSIHPEFALAVNRERARRICAQSGKVKAILQGHIHWNHADVIDGIPYITLESLVDSRTPGMVGQSAGAYAEVIADESGSVRVDVRGRLPVRYQYE